VDTDGNGKYDYLEVAVQVNVTGSRDFKVECNLFTNGSGIYLMPYGFNYSYLDTGSDITISFYGPTFYNARFNPQYFSQISLFQDYGGLL